MVLLSKCICAFLDLEHGHSFNQDAHPHITGRQDIVLTGYSQDAILPGCASKKLSSLQQRASFFPTAFGSEQAGAANKMQKQGNQMRSNTDLDAVASDDDHTAEDSQAVQQALEKDDEAEAEAENDYNRKRVDLDEVRENQYKRFGHDGGPKTIRPGPKRPMNCLFGTDYAQDCPRGWRREQKMGFWRNYWVCQGPPPPPPNIHNSLDQSKYGNVEALDKHTAKLYREAEVKFGKNTFYQPPFGTDCTNVLKVGLPAQTKHMLETKCLIHWPCNTDANGNGGLAPNYENMPDNICPTATGWTYNSGTGLCDAPYRYNGTCATKVNMLGFTPGMKAQWAKSCYAAWPLAKAKAKTIQDKPLFPPGTKHKNRKENGFKTEPEMPESLKKDGVEELPSDGKDGMDRNERAAAQMSANSAVLPDRTDPSQAQWARCGLDFSRACPVNWTPRGQFCIPPANYKGICPRSGVNLSRFSNDMKRAFMGHCGASWPCQGEFLSANPEPVAKNKVAKRASKGQSDERIVVLS